MRKLLAYYSIKNLSRGFVIGLVIVAIIYFSSGLEIFIFYLVIVLIATFMTPLVMEKSDEMVEEEKHNYTDKL